MAPKKAMKRAPVSNARATAKPAVPRRRRGIRPAVAPPGPLTQYVRAGPASVTTEITPSSIEQRLCSTASIHADDAASPLTEADREALVRRMLLPWPKPEEHDAADGDVDSGVECVDLDRALSELIDDTAVDAATVPSVTAHDAVPTASEVAPHTAATAVDDMDTSAAPASITIDDAAAAPMASEAVPDTDVDSVPSMPGLQTDVSDAAPAPPAPRAHRTRQSRRERRKPPSSPSSQRTLRLGKSPSPVTSLDGNPMSAAPSARDSVPEVHRAHLELSEREDKDSGAQRDALLGGNSFHSMRFCAYCGRRLRAGQQVLTCMMCGARPFCKMMCRVRHRLRECPYNNGPQDPATSIESGVPSADVSGVACITALLPCCQRHCMYDGVSRTSVQRG